MSPRHDPTCNALFRAPVVELSQQGLAAQFGDLHQASQVVRRAPVEHVVHVALRVSAGRSLKAAFRARPVAQPKHFAHRRPRVVSTAELFAGRGTRVTKIQQGEILS